jgi:hypothetical protein
MDGLHFNRSTPAFGDGGLKKAAVERHFTQRSQRSQRMDGLNFNRPTPAFGDGDLKKAAGRKTFHTEVAKITKDGRFGFQPFNLGLWHWELKFSPRVMTVLGGEDVPRPKNAPPQPYGVDGPLKHRGGSNVCRWNRAGCLLP